MRTHMYNICLPCHSLIDFQFDKTITECLTIANSGRAERIKLLKKLELRYFVTGWI